VQTFRSFRNLPGRSGAIIVLLKFCLILSNSASAPVSRSSMLALSAMLSDANGTMVDDDIELFSKEHEAQLFD